MATSIATISPNINIRESDLSVSTPPISEYNAAMAGIFSWGPCFQRKQVTNETELLQYYGLPDSTNFQSWFNAQRYLQYSSNLWICRAVDATTAKNAGKAIAKDGEVSPTIDLSSNPYVPNSDSALNFTATFGATEKLHVYAKYPGTFGNTKIKVSISNAADFATAMINSSKSFLSTFEYAPTIHATHVYYDQLAIVVQTQNIQNNNWEIVEKYIVDLDPTAKDYTNKSSYIENVINTRSQYIYIFDNKTLLEAPSSCEETLLKGGVNSTTDDADIMTALDTFSSSDNFPLWFLFDGGFCNDTIHKYIISICEQRFDTYGILSVPTEELSNTDISTAVNNCVTYRKDTLNANSSYAGLFGNAIKILDRYNDVYRWISCAGDVTGIHVNTIMKTGKVWTPCAGDIGILQNVLQLAIEPNLNYRETMCRASVIPIVSIPGQGVQIYDTKTLIGYTSAFSDSNVRLLFIYIEGIIKNAARHTLFKINDFYQRNLFKMIVEQPLDQIYSEGGFYKKAIVKCDETNNTEQIISTNGFIGDIYVTPVRPIKQISINFYAVNGSIRFEELVRS